MSPRDGLFGRGSSQGEAAMIGSLEMITVFLYSNAHLEHARTDFTRHCSGTPRR
jgi:hypothetical protein